MLRQPLTGAGDGDTVLRLPYCAGGSRRAPRALSPIISRRILVELERAGQDSLDEECPVIGVERRSLIQPETLLDIMDAGSSSVTAGCFGSLLQSGVMVSFAAASQRVGVIDFGGEHGVLLEGAAPPGTHDRGE